MLKTQKKLDLKITTPLGPTIVLDRLDGVEQISTPFCFSLEFHSSSPSLDLSKLVGQSVQISLDMHSEKRYFCGVIGEAEQGQTQRKDPGQGRVRNNRRHKRTANERGQLTLYRAKLYPKLWLLKFTQDYQIFQNKSALDIIKDVLDKNNVMDVDDKTTSKDMIVRDYCVQYGESDFDFISRLMEEEGIFYFFKHTEKYETLVLCDDQSLAEDALTEDIILTASQSPRSWLNEIQSFHLQEQVVVNQFCADDYNFETPKTELYTKISGNKGRHSRKGGEKEPAHRLYRYPGKFMKTEEAEAITSLRLQELEWFRNTVKGTSTVPLFNPMTRFALAGHPRPDANRPYVLHRVHHRIDQNTIPEFGRAEEPDDLIYENDFSAFPDDTPYRPPLITPKPKIYSTQTAIVTGKEEEEIWCDEYGRIKVKFHWDQSDVKDEKSSCWIRVAQLWSANGWGALFTPRVGMEVVVTYLDGDPDRPLVTGCVYNGENLPPYAKDEPTKSTFKSNTSKEGKGFNELRFEDKKDSEEIFIHAQKDMNTVIEDSRTLKIKTGDDTTTLEEGDRKVTLEGKKDKKAQRGNDTLTLTKGNRLVELSEGNHTLKISKGDEKTHLEKGNQIITLDDGNREQTLSKGDETIAIKGKRTISVQSDESHKNDGAYTHEVMGDCTLKVTGKLKITADGGITIESSTGDIKLKAMNIEMEATSGVKIKAGMDMKIESSMNMKVKSGLDLAIESTGNLGAKGSMTEIKGSIMTTVDGGPMLALKSSAVTKVDGSATVMIKGGMVMIN